MDRRIRADLKELVKRGLIRTAHYSFGQFQPMKSLPKSIELGVNRRASIIYRHSKCECSKHPTLKEKS